MSNILKQKNIVKLILTRLSKFGNIPNDGFLCGGAVANTLMSMEWGDRVYPVNDLDIFIESKRDKGSKAPKRTDGLIIEGAEYYHLNSSYNHGNNYKIISSERDGFINIIKVFRDRRSGKSKNFMYLLKGFDFNCVQVGIDLKSGELFYTDEFENFLNDRQLKVLAPYTPGHTAIRLIKKIDELQCYCDIDGQMKLLSQPFNNVDMIKHSAAYSGVFGMYFSEKYKVLYKKYEEKLSKYFKLVSLFEHKKWLWEKRNELNHFLDIGENHVANWLDPNRNPPQDMLDNWAKMNGKVWGLIPIKHHSPDGEFMGLIKDKKFTPLSLIIVWNLLYGGMKKTMVNKIKKIFKYNRLSELCIVNDNFYDCDFDDKNCKLVNDAIDENTRLGLISYKYRLNLQETIDVYKNINKILNKEGRWFNDLIYTIILENGNNFIVPNMTIINSLFETEKQKLIKPIINGVDLSGVEIPLGVEVKELISEYDLARAGRSLRNCIDDQGQEYKNKIRKGLTKIFVIITPNSMSALELTRVNDITYKKRWLLSYCNKECNKYHNLIGDYITSYVNRELIFSNISVELNKCELAMERSQKLLNPKDDTSTENNIVADHFALPTINGPFTDEDVNEEVEVFRPIIHRGNMDTGTIDMELTTDLSWSITDERTHPQVDPIAEDDICRVIPIDVRSPRTEPDDFPF